MPQICFKDTSSVARVAHQTRTEKPQPEAGHGGVSLKSQHSGRLR